MSRPKGSKNKPKIEREIESAQVPQEPDDIDASTLASDETTEVAESDGILINKNWKLISDSLNVLLCKRATVQSGKFKGNDIWVTKGYYGSIKGALSGLVDKEILGTGLKDLQTIDSKIDELKASIANLPVSRSIS